MIVKAISHKTPTRGAIKKILLYCFDPNKTKDNSKGRNEVVVKKYLRGYSMEPWVDAFLENDSKKIFNHQNRTVLRHEIVSFSKEDHSKITSEMLFDFGKWYLKNRSNALGVGTVHWEESIHFHFIIAGVGMDGRSTRITRKQFKEFKVRLQGFQKEKYPELSNALSVTNKDESELRAVWGADYNNIAEEVEEHQACAKMYGAHRC